MDTFFSRHFLQSGQFLDKLTRFQVVKIRARKQYSVVSQIRLFLVWYKHFAEQTSHFTLNSAPGWLFKTSSNNGDFFGEESKFPRGKMLQVFLLIKMNPIPLEKKRLKMSDSCLIRRNLFHSAGRLIRTSNFKESLPRKSSNNSFSSAAR